MNIDNDFLALYRQLELKSGMHREILFREAEFAFLERRLHDFLARLGGRRLPNGRAPMKWALRSEWLRRYHDDDLSAPETARRLARELRAAMEEGPGRDSGSHNACSVRAAILESKRVTTGDAEGEQRACASPACFAAGQGGKACLPSSGGGGRAA